MVRSRHPRQSRGVVAATNRILPSFDDEFDDEQSTNENATLATSVETDENSNENSITVPVSNDNENSNENDIIVPVSKDNENIPVDANEEIRLKSNVWTYAKKISKEQAQCIKCKLYVKTPGGGTTTLRKHLVTKHKLAHLLLDANPRIKTDTSISHEQKIRLDLLANLAIFEDGRTFGDLRKPGIRKFLSEAIPGYVPPHRNQVQRELNNLDVTRYSATCTTRVDCLLYGYFDPLGYSTLTSREKSQVERHLKQISKTQNKSQVSTTMSSTSSSSIPTPSSTIPTSSSTIPTSSDSGNTNMKHNNEKLSRLDAFLKSVDKYAPSKKFIPKTLSEEISHYGSLCKNGSSKDATTFWLRHGDEIPLLKTMARKYLSTPGTSVPSESAFSLSAYIGRKERARLTPENISYTVFLQDKLRSL